MHYGVMRPKSLIKARTIIGAFPGICGNLRESRVRALHLHEYLYCLEAIALKVAERKHHISLDKTEQSIVLELLQREQNKPALADKFVKVA